MAITSENFQNDDALPDDASQGPNPAHGFNVIDLQEPPSPPGSPPGVATLVGQLVTGDVTDHDHGFAFLVDDPATADIVPQAHDNANTSTTVGASSNGPVIDALTGYPPGVTS